MDTKIKYSIIITAILAFTSGIPLSLTAQIKENSNPMEEISVKTPAFTANGMIPSKYTCEGENISPALEWSALPEKTKSIVLVMDDPDAPNGDWVHFILFNIPPETRQLAGSFRLSDKPSPLMKAGLNSAGKLDYHGPCPPAGIHRYYFKLYALDIILNQPEGITKQDLLKAINGHILAKGEIMGRYRKIK